MAFGCLVLPRVGLSSHNKHEISAFNCVPIFNYLVFRSHDFLKSGHSDSCSEVAVAFHAPHSCQAFVISVGKQKPHILSDLSHHASTSSCFQSKTIDLVESISEVPVSSKTNLCASCYEGLSVSSSASL